MEIYEEVEYGAFMTPDQFEDARDVFICFTEFEQSINTPPWKH